VRVGLADRTRNGTVWKDMGVVFITSIVECGCDFDSEGEDTSDYLNGRGRDRERGSAGCGETEELTSTLRISQGKRGRSELWEWRGRKSAICTTPPSLRNLV